MKRSKLYQIVKSTGYSVATVSRALNEETAGVVREATRKKIYTAAEKIDYIPNRMAKSLRRQRTDTFGFLINFETDTISGYVHEILNGVIDGLKGSSLDLKIVSSARHHTLQGIIKIHGLDGLILPYGYGHEFPDLARESEQYKNKAWPVVMINDYHRKFYMSQLYSDNYSASRHLAEYLIDKGYRRFFFIGCGSDSPDSSARKKGFLDAMKERKLRFDVENDIANGYFTEQGGYEAANRFLSRKSLKHSVIFCLNDSMALGAIRAIGQAGFKCPDEIAVTGFDGIAAGEFSNPPLTTVKLDLHEMGRSAVIMLKDILAGRQKRFVKKKFPFKLIERQSA
ncbi:MAG: LacI family DNA-binding transcriptional regulator [Candidatus Omnitrophica bacterium]|nr:LacI family DNA-binding transcriptional regulator [Candidatus Omnitrophota bacterium]